MLDTIWQGVWLADETHRIVYANEPMARIAGVSLPDILGRSVLTDFPEETLRDFRPHYDRALASGAPTDYALHLVTPAGRESWQRGLLLPLHEGGRYSGMICTVQDETEQVREKREIEDRLKFAEAIVERNRDGIMLVDETGRAVKANARMAQMLGYSVQKLLGLYVWDWDDSATLEGVRRCIGSIDAKGFQFETRHRRKDGSFLDVEISKSAVISGGRTLIVAMHRDITLRKQAEAKLRESEAALNRAQALARLGSWTTDRVTGRFEPSAEARRIFGFAPDQPLTRDDLFGQIHPDDRPEMQRRFDTAEAGTPFGFEHRVLTPEGVRWVRGRAEVSIGATDEIVSTMGTILDITESKQLELALRQSEGRYRALVETTADSIWELGPDGRYTYVSPRIEAILGYRPEELIGRKPQDFMEAHEADRLQGTLEAQIAGRRAFTAFEVRYRHNHGHTVIVETSGVPVVGEDGAFLGYRGTDRDVTARREAENRLLESEFFLRQSQRVGRVGGWRINPERGSVLCTEEVFILLELPVERSLALRALLDRCSPPCCHDLEQRLWRAYRQGEAFVCECPVETASGRSLWLEFRGFPEEVGGRIDHVVGTLQDITEHKQALLQLRRAKEQAEAANKAKTNFLASMSHELRTPLNAVIGFSDLLSLTEKDPERRKQLSIIHQAASSLMRLIQDILDLTKIESGRIEVQPAPFDLHTTVHEIVSLFDLQANRKGLDLVLTIAPDVPHWVQGDVGLMRQVLINLIGNALKFTQQGGVKVLVERADSMEAEPFAVIFHVLDTGIGVRPENQERIFEMFEQENSSETREYAGSGLGLAISKRLVSLMGGQIWVQSEPEVGSRFSFSLPAQPIEALPPIATGHPARARRQADQEVWVLVVEDDSFGQQLLARILQEHGYRVETVSTGGDALAVLAMQRFDLVLLDIQLPGVSGLEVAERIRSGAIGGCDPDLPVIAVTAYAMRGDRARFLGHGFTEYVSKPFDRTELLSKIEANLYAARTRPAASA